tara:strand:+ start:217 stop:801 length:585 start_codon:yes stop_codon:yes gene_type:complete
MAIKKIATIKTVTPSANAVETFISNSRGAEYGFFKAVQVALINFKDKNNLSFYKLAAYTNGKKFGRVQADPSGKRFNSPLKRIIEQALPNVKLVFKDGKCAVKIEGEIDIKLLDNAIKSVEMLAASKTMIASEAFDNAFPKPDVLPTIKTVDQQRDQLTKYLEKFAKDNGITFENAKAMVSSLSVVQLDIVQAA